MRRIGTLLTALALTACVGGSNENSKQDKERLQGFVLSSAPEFPIKLDIDFDDKITLLGARVDPAGKVSPGQKVKVTMYWRCNKSPGDGWLLFTHVLDGSGERILNIDNVGPLREWKGSRQALPPGNWDAGKIYVDEQEFTVPADVKTSKIQFTTGIWKGNDRLKIKSGPADRENKARVVEIETSVAARPAVPAARVPELRVDKLEKGTKITIDGKLDEAAWKTAVTAGPFVDVKTGEPNTTFPVNGSVKVLWDDTHMYLGFDVKDPDVVGGFDKKAKDPHLWTKDAVEIMIDPDGDGDNKDYYEIQINPQNLVFDTRFDEYNKPKTEPDGPFGHQDWSANLKSAVTVNGTLDKSEDKDEGYVVEVAIPWKSFDKARQVPPKVGDTWRMNFYAMQNNGGVAWSPILGQGNFHKASRFGKVLWAEKGWQPAPTPARGTGPSRALQPLINPQIKPHLLTPVPVAPPKP